jgi:hypothetical protein
MKLNRWEIFWAMVAVGLVIGFAVIAIWFVVSDIDITPHQIYTFDGVQYDCEFPAPDVMECKQVDDPDVGFGRTQ